MATLSAINGYILSNLVQLIVITIRHLARQLARQLYQILLDYAMDFLLRARRRMQYHLEQQPAAAPRRYPLRQRHPPQRLIYY